MLSLANQRRQINSSFAADVRAGLNSREQKTLPSKYLYDALGSALFEAITLLPEYGLTRADERLLKRHAFDISQHIPPQTIVSELGSGSGRKTRWILRALREAGSFYYYPIEISRAALTSCEVELADIEAINIVGLELEYLEGLREVVRRRPAGKHVCVLFLGSTIGNFDFGMDIEFLSEMRTTLMEGDFLLMGTDLLKAREVLLDAYDDPQGVTASFNLNLLKRINQELNADFNMRQFEHLALFNDKTDSIEMHLRSKRTQSVHIESSEMVVSFDAGETILTERCHKYTYERIADLAECSGFNIKAQWIDEEWPFANTLFEAI